MVVAETMAAIALARSAVSGVQSVINTCKDVSEISGQIDQMFHAHEQVHKKSSAKGNKEWNNYLTQKLKDGGEEEGGAVDDEWEAHVDEDTGHTYWCHVHTGESTWHKPT